MANAYTVIRNRQGWIDPTDQDFTLKALMFKQQKYDANQAKVQSVIENYKSLQLARGVDREYLNERLTNLINNINQYGPQDFSSNAVTQSIQYHLGQTLDDNVMTAVQETAKIRAYQAEVSKVKEKNPELYNALNEAYGLAPAQEYMEDGQVGTKIKGNLTYTPYKDVEGEVNKWLTDIQMKAKDGVIELQDPNTPGRIIKHTINGRSSEELRQLALGFLGTKYDDQLRVNVWGQTGGFKNLEPMVQSAVGEYNSDIQNKTMVLSELRAKMTGPVSQQELEEMKAQEKALENSILTTRQMRDSIQNNPVNSLIFLEKNKISNRSGQALGLLQTTSVEYKKDDYFFAAMDAELDARKFDFEMSKHADDMSIQSERLKIEREKLELDALKAASDGSGGSSSSGSKGSQQIGEYSVLIEDIDVAGLSEQQESYKDMWQADISNKYQAAHTFGVQVMNNIEGIANGTIKADANKIKEAKLLIQQFQQKGGQLNKNSGRQVQAFMNTLSRDDAYNSLRVLPIGGANVLVKDRYNELATDWAQSSVAYNTARQRAQQEEVASGRKASYGDNEGFVEAAKRNSPFFARNTVSVTVTDKNEGELARLIQTGTLQDGAALANDQIPILAKNTRYAISEGGDGKFLITYMAKGKDGDKNAVNETHKVLVNKDIAKRVLPFLNQYESPNTRYTLSSMGTKPLYSPNLRYLGEGEEKQVLSEEIEKFSANPRTDINLLEVHTAKKEVMNSLGIVGIPNKEVRDQVTQLVDLLISEEAMRGKLTSARFGYSTVQNEGIAYLDIVNKQGEKLISQRINHRGGAIDSEVKMNRLAPQVTYTKLVGNEIGKAIAGWRETGVFQLTPGLNKLINGR